MSFGDMHKNEVDASLISHETLNPTYQPVYNLDLDSLRLSFGPRKKIRAKKELIASKTVPYRMSVVSLLKETLLAG